MCLPLSYLSDLQNWERSLSPLRTPCLAVCRDGSCARPVTMPQEKGATVLTDVFQRSRSIGRRKRLSLTRRRLEVELLEARCLLSFQILGTLGTTVSLPTGPAFRINDFEPNG